MIKSTGTPAHQNPSKMIPESSVEVLKARAAQALRAFLCPLQTENIQPNPEKIGTYAVVLSLFISVARRLICCPLLSKLPSSSHRVNASRSAGYSLSMIEYHAVSRLRWCTTTACRNMPSKVKPKRVAAAREGALSASHFHSTRRYPSPSKT